MADRSSAADLTECSGPRPSPAQAVIDALVREIDVALARAYTAPSDGSAVTIAVGIQHTPLEALTSDIVAAVQARYLGLGWSTATLKAGYLTVRGPPEQ